MCPAIPPLVAAARRLRVRLRKLAFAPPVTHVYNPLVYAAAAHEQYLTAWGSGTRKVLFLGMNPGPLGMAQTGVPFGEVVAVRDWIGISAVIGKPRHEHPKRPITGLECPRSEVSGQRLWGLFAERFQTPERFFTDHFVTNYCPLAFMEESGRNRTPDKLPANERAALTEPCDRHLREVVAALAPEIVVGVGRFALDRARAALADFEGRIETILHPSPASPAANRGWGPRATRQLQDLGIWS
ncbi:MAG: uracil-DNA glycosylase family protein [Candidatus Latescibacterota bacterium]|nr:uracil-DNA glycosylase family protein [Candidatus Latescibacterota bacterium]